MPGAVGALSKWGSLESMEGGASGGFARWDSSLAVGEGARGGAEVHSGLRHGATADEVSEGAAASGPNSSFVEAMPTVPVVVLNDDTLLEEDDLSIPAMHRHARPASFRRQAEPALDNSAPLLRDKTMVRPSPTLALNLAHSLSRALSHSLVHTWPYRPPSVTEEPPQQGLQRCKGNSNVSVTGSKAVERPRLKMPLCTHLSRSLLQPWTVSIVCGVPTHTGHHNRWARSGHTTFYGLARHLAHGIVRTVAGWLHFFLFVPQLNCVPPTCVRPRAQVPGQ